MNDVLYGEFAGISFYRCDRHARWRGVSFYNRHRKFFILAIAAIVFATESDQGVSR